MSKIPPKEEASPYPDVIIEGHDYDGIKEYDNPMPAWWLWLFYATIAWSIFYVAALGVGWIDGYDEQLEQGQQYVAELRSAAEEDRVVVEVTEEYLLELLEDEAKLSAAERTYNTRCASCHGMQGEGGIGPAFADGQWDAAQTPVERFEVVRDGIPAGGMPSFEPMMSQEEIASVTAFIESF